MAAAASARTSGDGSWMSGRHQVDAAGRRDPGQAADGALAHRVVGVVQAVPRRPPRSRKPMETSAWVAYSCSARLGQQLDERPLRARLLEPAQGDGGGAAVLGVVVAQRGEQVVDEVLAPQRGLHLGVQALAARGGALLDGHHGLDGHVAQRGVGVVAGAGTQAAAAPRARPGGPGPP